MARFRFPLEGLLKVRRLEEDRAKLSFLTGLKALREKESELEEVVRHREEGKDRLRSASGGAIDIEDVLRTRRFINVLFARIEERRREIALLRPSIEEARSAFRKASVRRRAIEKARERALREHRQEEDRRERRDLDELAGVRFLRRRTEAEPAAAGGES